MKHGLQLSLGFVFLSTVMLAQSPSDRAAVDVATKTIRPDQIRAHIRFLADSLLTAGLRVRPATIFLHATWLRNWKAWVCIPVRPEAGSRPSRSKKP
jgi:hypothetical protein